MKDAQATYDVLGFEIPSDLLDGEAEAFMHYLLRVEDAMTEMPEYREEVVEGYDYLTHFRRGDSPVSAALASLRATGEG